MKRTFSPYALVISILMILISGCASTTRRVVLESEREGIKSVNYGFEFSKKADEINCAEFIIRSDPSGAEVYGVKNDKSECLLGKTPLALPFYTWHVFYAFPPVHLYDYIPKDYFFVEQAYLNKHDAFFSKYYTIHIKLTNILLKHDGYYPYIISENIDPNLEYKWSRFEADYQQYYVRYLGKRIHGASFTVQCPMVLDPEKFDLEYSQAIVQKDFAKAERLIGQRRLRLQQAIERDGKNEEYQVEIERMKSKQPVSIEQSKP